MKRRLVGLAACVALAGILVGLPVVLLSLGWDGVPGTWQGWWLLLSRPDDGTLLLALLRVAGWVLWAILAVLCLVEIGAAVRGVTPVTVPGLGWSQVPLRRLVAAAALLFVLPGVIATATPTPAVADPGPQPQETVAAAPASAGKVVGQAPTEQHAPAKKQAATRPYTVKQGDSLWTIAEKTLGDGERYPEIVALNRARLGDRPDFLQVGWKLTVPDLGRTDTSHDDGGDEHTRYTVRKGDTLRGIAKATLGDEDRYGEIFKASRDTVQPGGYRLTDPDQIDVGWTLTIPTKAENTKTEKAKTEKTEKAGKDRASDTRTDVPVQPKRIPADAPATTQPSTAPQATTQPSTAPQTTTQPSTAPQTTTAPTQPVNGEPAPTVDAPSSDRDTVETGWLVAGLVGSGAILGGGLWMLLRRRRQAQFRARRPGRTIAPPPAAAAPVERTLITEGPQGAQLVTGLDAALRTLAAAMVESGTAMPQLLAVELHDQQIRLHLDQGAALPAPWTEIDPTTWNLAGGDAPQTATGPAPYPLLVSIGEDSDGTTWLLNVEQLGTVYLAGDATFSHDYARYMVAEMATNPWSGAVRVDCIGVAAAGAALEPSRIHHYDSCGEAVDETLRNAGDTLSRANRHNVDAATGRVGDVGGDTWPGWMMVLEAGQVNEAAQKMVALNTTEAGRTGVAVVMVDGDAPVDDLTLTFTADGTVRVADWDLTLTSAGLTIDEVHGCAVLLSSCDADDVPIPPSGSAEPWREHCDDAGALLADSVLPRSMPAADLPEPAGTVLSGADADIIQVAATTTDDLQALAPWVPVRVRDAVAEADPTLDQDLAAWRSGTDLQPRLWLLGPIKARTSTRGNPLAVKQRRAFYTELLAFLALRPAGATTEQVSDAFGMEAGTVRKHMGVLRDWLRDTADGGKHLPQATQSPAGKARGVGVYQLQDVLVDVDLFRRLRQRGESRGPDGVKDLTDALSLVTGEPFTGQRPGGWGWLAAGDRVDQHMLCAVIDVAHLTVTAALHAGDLAAARAAAEVAVGAAPYDDVTRLDLAAVTAAEGDRSEAARIVNDEVCNRHVDGDAPMDLSARSAQVVASPQWLRDGRVA